MTTMPTGPRRTYDFLEDEVDRDAGDLSAAIEAAREALGERRRLRKFNDPVVDYLSGVSHAGRWLGQKTGAPMWRGSEVPHREAIEEELDFARRVAVDVSAYPAEEKEIGMTAEFARGVVDMLMYAIDMSAAPPSTT